MANKINTYFLFIRSFTLLYHNVGSTIQLYSIRMAFCYINYTSKSFSTVLNKTKNSDENITIQY